MSQPWYRRFPDNFLGGTNGMTLEEKGAYSVVIDMIYQRGGPIADEPRYIAGICNCSVRKWNAIRARLLDLNKLYLIDGKLMNERAAEEIEKAARIARELAENGAKGGDKSAQIRAAAKKDKDLGQAPLKLSRASSTSTPLKKEAQSASVPTESLVAIDERSADFMAVTKLRGAAPFLGKDFKARVPASELALAREKFGVAA